MAWWHWLVIGLLLGLSELIVPAFFLLWLGIAAIAVSLLVLLVPLGVPAQIIIWAILSAALVVLWLRVFKSRIERTGTAAAAQGEVGLLITDVAPFQPGRVRFQRPVLGADVWECMSEETLRAGSRVRVIGVEGRCVRIVAA